jgi:excisionase family DNA binding protein
MATQEETPERWMSVREAAQLSGYTGGYIRRLAMQGRVQGHKVGRAWRVEAGSVLRFKARMEALGNSRHNPWAQQRADLERRGMGRGATPEVKADVEAVQMGLFSG